MHERTHGNQPPAAAGRRGLAALAAVLACAGGSLAAGSAAEAAASHHGATVAAAATQSEVWGVSAVSPSNAWAVGFELTSNGAQPLIVRWNGTSWKKLTLPSLGQSPELSAVSALSAKSAWTVGHYFRNGVQGSQSLILHWNGTSWTQVPSPDPGGANGTSLSAVSALSADNAWAVGSDGGGPNGASESLVLHWNGTSWKQLPSPSPGTGLNLTGVTAVSPSNAWAVGSYFNTSTSTDQSLVLHWNGTSWKQVTSPNPSSTANFLNSVSADSPTDAWAVGNYKDSSNVYQSYVLHWNGTSWTQLTSPSPSTIGNDLTSVKAISPTDAWAVGYYYTGNVRQTLIMHWDGTSWTQVTSPNPSATGNTLNSVSADSATDAWAVGLDLNSSAPQSLALRWNGTSWKQVTSPN